jgi:hypothetical protein
MEDEVEAAERTDELACSSVDANETGGITGSATTFGLSGITAQEYDDDSTETGDGATSSAVSEDDEDDDEARLRELLVCLVFPLISTEDTDFVRSPDLQEETRVGECPTDEAVGDASVRAS